MNKKLFRSLALLFFGVTGATAFAQNVNVMSSNGSSSSFDISTVQSMVFSNGNMIVNDSGCEDSYFSLFFTDQVTFGEGTTGIAETTAGDIRLYPNPAVDQLTIERQKTTATTAVVYSLVGEQVAQFPVSGTSASFDISRLTSGVYLLSVDQQRIKFVKQ